MRDLFFKVQDYERAFSAQAGRKNAGAVIEAARKEIGVCETGENAGKRVDEYCAYVGLQKVAWCAAFSSWCFGQAGFVRPRTAWCPALFPEGRLRKDPLRGMIMGIYFPSKGRIAHCGIVEKVRGDFVYVIEGNTNVAGSRDGDRVMRRLRHKRTIARYADWLN
jgi:hypothetical protein